MEIIKILSSLMMFFVSFLQIESIHTAIIADERIINPQQVYSYEIMTEDIYALVERYPELITYQSIGTTSYGRNIWAVKIGKGEAVTAINGAHHAREWLTTNLAMNMIEEYAIGYIKGQSLSSFNIRGVLDKASIWFIPMVNPDGVSLQQKGLEAFPEYAHPALLKLNNGSNNFVSWKANADGIDLNRQYPAGWYQVIKSSPGNQGYKGEEPLIARETKALAEFTKKINPEITVSYHTSGRIIYWNYRTPIGNVKRDRRIADQIASMTGYDLVPPSTSIGSGYTDWFIQTFSRPGFTIEISPSVIERNPPLSVYPEVWRRNREIGLYIASEGYELWKKRTIKNFKWR